MNPMIEPFIHETTPNPGPRAGGKGKGGGGRVLEGFMYPAGPVSINLMT